jgi:hypothetical protein
VTFPGLGALHQPWEEGGSRVYPGDTTCDATPHFGFEDINPFVDLVTRGCCDPDCPGCPGDSGEAMSPQELAKQLADNVWPELYDDLVWVVGQAAEAQPDDESRAYWEAVYAALTE